MRINIRVIAILLMLYTAIPQNTRNANALIPVTDYASIFLNIARFIKDILFQAWGTISAEYYQAQRLLNDAEMLYRQFTMIKNQLTQIEHAAMAIKNIDPSTYQKLKASVQDNFDKNNNLFNQLRGLNDNVESIAAKFESAYPTLEAMAKLDPVGWKGIVNTSAKAQTDGIYNANLKAANIRKLNEQMQAKLNALSDENGSAEGIVEVTQLGNQIALQQQQLTLMTNENLVLMLKQNADNMNNMIMVQQAMQLEASRTFKYTPQRVSENGPGLYHIK